MYENPFAADAVENYAQKCCVALVLDTSTSMSGARIEQLNAGIQSFIAEINADQANLGQKLEIGIVTFDSAVTRLAEPKLTQSMEFKPLTTAGLTKMVDGVQEGIKMVRQRKQWYKETGQKYYRPWVIMITDGEPDSDQLGLLPGLAAEIHAGMETKEFCFLAIGVEGVNKGVLQQLSHPEIPPRMLDGLKFGAFFRWLSATIADVAKGESVSDAIKKSSDQSWDGGFKI
jgi:uncharacterized protein YegL